MTLMKISDQGQIMSAYQILNNRGQSVVVVVVVFVSVQHYK